MKKLISTMLIASTLLTGVACNNSSSESTSKSNTEESVVSEYDTTTYDREKYLMPYFEGNVIINESIMPMQKRSGEVDPIGLMYTPTEIISIKSSDLQTTYKAGKDYKLVGGKIEITDGSSIPCMNFTDYYLMTPNIPQVPLLHKNGSYVRYEEGTYFHDRQLAVTYKHSGENLLTKPQNKGDGIPATMQKLNNKEPLNVLVYGDSISVGANATGFEQLNCEPFTPVWAKMVEQGLKANYGYNNITVDNSLSKGGEATEPYGKLQSNLDALVAKKPDLLIISFGMNDAGARSKDQFIANVNYIMEYVQSRHTCEIVLLSSMLANPDVSFGSTNSNLLQYASAYRTMEKQGMINIDMTSITAELQAKKEYSHMAGNNINHPNDFVARLYAQVILQSIKN